MHSVSRRDFLKLSGLGLLGISLPARPLRSVFSTETPAVWTAARATASPDDVIQQGRVTSRLIWVYDRPSLNARQLRMYWRDSIVPITNVVISQDESDYNRIWYEIDGDGYAYSGTLQPVRTLLNTPTLDIPSTGVMGEVSVPYTDAHEDSRLEAPAAYRMYYQSVHWILSAIQSSVDGKIWYLVLDDKWHKMYYAPGEHLRLIADEELAPYSPDVPATQKRIQVRLDQQLVLAYENDQPVFATRAATGAMFSSGTYTTPAGHFMTYHKRPTRHMANGDITASGFDLAGVPWVMYFTESGLSLHGTYWHNDFGHPKSHGCVNLSVEAAKWLFRWTTPVVKPHDQFAYDFTGTALEIVRS